MLTVGVTGGIGSGKSTVARRLRELGAVVVDADVVAREVMGPGSATLAQVAGRFGPGVLRDDGTLDRPGLAALVFSDPAALALLDAITTPAITARVAQMRAQTPSDRVTVFDMPLLVERRLWPKEHLTVVVGASEDVRVARLVEQRGLTETDARHRIAAQASDDERRAAADVWLDNDGDVGSVRQRVDELWVRRLVPYEANLQSGPRSHRPDSAGAAVVPADPGWAAEGIRLAAKLGDVLGDRALSVEHIGSTSVPHLIAKDVVDLQVGVRRLADADQAGFVDDLRVRGFVRVEGIEQDHPHPSNADPTAWRKRLHGSMDPGRVANVHVREFGSPGWVFALELREWLRSVPTARDAYAAEKRRLLATVRTTREYAEAKEPWFDEVYPTVIAWAEERSR